MQFRVGRGGPSAGLGCGGLLALLGLVLISPVGEWLIKALGWILLAVGVIVVTSSIYYWVTRRGN
jgi:hypothetical protein